jgi:hypothetical protein
MVESFGPVAKRSEPFEFSETDYYESSMGRGLRKVLFVFERPFEPTDLVGVKLQTNAWEKECVESSRYAEPRPLNLDPGYLTLGKLVLASTKDFLHRLYLSRGIYGEVTLYFKHHGWQHHAWTFPDYRRDDYQRFLTECRQWLHGQLRKEPTGSCRSSG